MHGTKSVGVIQSPRLELRGLVLAIACFSLSTANEMQVLGVDALFSLRVGLRMSVREMKPANPSRSFRESFHFCTPFRHSNVRYQGKSERRTKRVCVYAN